MENMDKGLTVPKWVLINRPKILKMPQNASAQIVCQSPKVWDFDEKKVHWASIVRDLQFIAVTIESAFTITFLVVSRTFMTNTAVSPICQYLIQLLFVEKKIADFQKSTGLGGYLKAQRALRGLSEGYSCWKVRKCFHIMLEYNIFSMKF